ncbi:hypothetical protein FOZ62_001965, partial [Perkinsus olseni]
MSLLLGRPSLAEFVPWMHLINKLSANASCGVVSELHEIAPSLFKKTRFSKWFHTGWQKGVIQDAHYCFQKLSSLANSGVNDSDQLSCFTPAMEEHIRSVLAEARRGDIRHSFEIHKFAGSRVDKQFWIAGTKETNPQMDLFRLYGNRFCTEQRHIFRDAVQLARESGLVARMHVVVSMRQSYWVEDRHGEA